LFDDDVRDLQENAVLDDRTARRAYTIESSFGVPTTPDVEVDDDFEEEVEIGDDDFVAEVDDDDAIGAIEPDDDFDLGDDDYDDDDD
jgi:DNA-directed RNA polymerase subunit beta'